MKKLTFILILGIFPIGAFAVRTGQGTCEYETTITTPAGYCCISYQDPNYTEVFWKCDDLDLNSNNMAECKLGKSDCIDYCYSYDLDNDTCSDKTCNGPQQVTEITDSEDCTIPNAILCDYDWVCDSCGKNCHREDEKAYDCIDEHYYLTTDFKHCSECPGNGVFDWDLGNVGIAGCYINRSPMTGSDATGTFKYVNDKCYYKE